LNLRAPTSVRVVWPKTHRIVRSRFPPVDLFEDIADPADWNAILSAEAKTNPRVAESVGMLDLVPEERRVAGVGASRAMAPFVHASPDRPSRFSDGSFGVCHAGDRIEVALFETMHRHAAFMAATDEAAGWTSDFRELVGSLDAELHDVTDASRFAEMHDPEDHSKSRILGATLRAAGSDGILHRSVRFPEGRSVALFWPDVARILSQGEHFSYYWDGCQVSRVRNLTTGDMFSVVE